MKFFWELIPRSLIKNKKRTIFISISIMLASMLITSLNLTLSNYKAQKIENAKNQGGGHYYASCFEAGNPQSIETLKKEPSIDKFGTSIIMGYAEIADDFKIELSGYDSVDTELLDFKLEEGRYPKEDSEIALEKWTLDKYEVKPKIGDKIKLNYIFNYMKVENDKQSPAVKKGEKEFTLSGILQNRIDSMEDKKSKGYLTINSVKNTLDKDEYRYIHHFTLKPSTNIDKTLKDMSKIKGVFINQNYSYINTLDLFKKSNMVFTFLNIIIIIASISVIYNIYSISVVERIREFGLLRAIGCETEQIKKLIYGEGAILGCLFIPVGIILGIISINQINKLFSFAMSFKGKAEISFAGILLPFIACFISIFISIYFPSKKASKISPMEAINNTSIQGEELDTLKGNKKIQGFSKFTTAMAYTNLTRNKKRFLVTIISLSISTLLFIVVTSLCIWMDPLRNVESNINSDYILSVNNSEKNIGYDENAMNEILNLEGISTVKKNMYFRSSLEVSGNKLTEVYKENLKKIYSQNNMSDSRMEKDIYPVQVELYGCNDEQLKEMNKYLEDGKLDLEDMKKNNQVILIQNQSNEKSTNLKVSDKFNMSTALVDNSNWEHYKKEINIGAILKELPFPTMDHGINTVVIMHEDALKQWLNEEKYRVLRINVKKDSNENYIKNKLNEYAKKQKEGKLISYRDELEFYENAQKSISIILHSFVVIIAIIGIVNIINTISMNIILRRKEFGMIRAIGMGNDEIRAMILKEGLLYGIFSTLIGSSLGILIHGGLYKVLKYDKAIKWFFPWKSILEVFIVSMIICILASIGPLKRLLFQSIIDSIRTVE